MESISRPDEKDITKEGKIIEYVHSYQHHCEMRKTSEEFVQSLSTLFVVVVGFI